MTYYKKKRKGYGTKIIKHPQGTYKVMFLTPKKTLSKSKLLWFKDHKGRYIQT